MTLFWTRRRWLAVQGAQVAALARRRLAPQQLGPLPRTPRGTAAATPATVHATHTTQAALLDAGPLEALTQQAVEAATAAGADYADARFTRIVRQNFNLSGSVHGVSFGIEVGLGIRALVHGYWGFAASYDWTPSEAVRLARQAVAQAQISANGPPRVVDLGSIPAVIGRWVTPIRIEPFRDVSLEEKLDTFNYWKARAAQAGVQFRQGGATSVLRLKREERVLATSGGSTVHQTLYESGATFDVRVPYGPPNNEGIPMEITGIDFAGLGWEHFLDAKIPEQFAPNREATLREAREGGGVTPVGRYTIVCDGATMASLVAATLGSATQLDRALGYEANAAGTSFIDDPLNMVGSLQVTSPLVNVTANRSAPAQLATVKWDDEAVAPPEFTLVKDGVLTDFQTTQEQAAWLAPYYQKVGRSVQSNGCAGAYSAHYLTIQHPPNLAMAPNPQNVSIADLVATVKEGLLIEKGGAGQMDAQARNGLLAGRKMRRIRNGRLGAPTGGGSIMFSTKDLWKKIIAVGGASTVGQTQFPQIELNGATVGKGEPVQALGSCTAMAAAAVITNQPMINEEARA